MHPLHQRRRSAPIVTRAVPPPQAPDRAGARELKLQLTGMPGLRLAAWQGRRTYHAADLTPQRFTHGPSGPNQVEALRLAAGQLNAKRVTGKTRGLPPGRE